MDANGDSLTADQRGRARIRAATRGGVAMVDMGAVETDPPLIASFGGAATYTENAGPTRVAPASVVTDSDTPSFGGGRLVARLTANAEAADRLLIATFGNISTSGNQVLFAGAGVVGTFTGGGGTTPLTVVFAAQVDGVILLQDLLRSLGFQNTSENPSSSPRTLAVFMTDGAGGKSNVVTKAINVVPVNDAPVLTPANGGAVGYPQNSAVVQLLGNATVTDPDSANFAGGILIVRAISGGNVSNRLLIFNGFAFDGLNVKRVSDGLVIGTRNTNGGVGTTRLEITFNANATPGLVQHVVRGIYFRTAGGNSTAQRVIEFSLTDGDGGASNKVNKTVNVTN